MKTRTRRFVLRLIVALLTFLIGVMAAMVLGHSDPLDDQYVRPRAQHSCVDRAWQALPPPPPAPALPPDAPAPPRAIYPVFRPDSSAAPRPPQAPTKPVLPSFEDEGEIKSPGSDTPRRAR